MSAVKKGRHFEGEVAAWLLTNGYRHVERNVKVRVSDDVKPYECDVHVHCYSDFWDRLRAVGRVGAGFCCIAGLVQARSVERLAQSVVYQFSPDLAPYGLLVVCLILLYVAVIGKKKTGHHVWVECKSLKGKVNRDHVSKLAHTIDLLDEYKYADWLPRYVMIFSATDFERDALHLARQNNFVCYRRCGDDFEKVL